MNAAGTFQAVPMTMGINSLSGPLDSGWPFAECLDVITDMLLDFTVELQASSLAEDEQGFHLQCKASIISILTPLRATASWDQVKSQITDTLLAKLDAADFALRRTVFEEMLLVEDLRALREAIEAALKLISSSTLPDEVKRFTITSLLRILTALDQYRFRGLAGFEEAVAGYLGTLGVVSKHIEEHIAEPERRKLTEILTLANTAMNLAHTVAVTWPLLHAGFAAVTKLISV